MEDSTKTRLISVSLHEILDMEVAAVEIKIDDLFRLSKNWFVNKARISSTPCPWLGKKFNIVAFISQYAHTGELHEGSAIGDSRDDTVLRAVSESYERYIYGLNKVKYNLCSSSGFASHSMLKRAVINSILEVIERDALLHTWFEKLSPVAVLTSDSFNENVCILKKFGYDVTWYQLSSDWSVATNQLYVVLAVIKPVSERSYFRKMFCSNDFMGRIIGSACSFSAHDAMRKSFEEASMLAWFLYFNQEQLDYQKSDVCSNMDHARFYWDKKNAKAFNFIESAGLRTIRIESESIGLTCDDAIDIISRAAIKINHDPRFFIFTNPVLDDDLFYVVLCKVDSMQRLWFGHSYSGINRARINYNLAVQQEWPHPLS